MLTVMEIMIAALAFVAGAVTATTAIWIWMYNAMKPPRRKGNSNEYRK